MTGLLLIAGYLVACLGYSMCVNAICARHWRDKKRKENGGKTDDRN